MADFIKPCEYQRDITLVPAVRWMFYPRSAQVAYTSTMTRGIRGLFFTLALSAPLAFGQLDSNSLTVTASRGVSLQPDQALFGVFVDSSTVTSLDDILAALQGSGVTIANFSGVSTSTATLILGGPPTPLPPGPGGPVMLEWAFALPVSLAKITSTIKTLTGLQQSIMQNNSGLTLSFSIVGTQVSPQLQQMQTCVLADLISDAQAQAQKVAAAAGLGVGNILALSSPVVTSVSNGTTVPVSRLTSSISSLLTSPPICTVTVKFALVRF